MANLFISIRDDGHHLYHLYHDLVAFLLIYAVPLLSKDPVKGGAYN